MGFRKYLYVACAWLFFSSTWLLLAGVSWKVHLKKYIKQMVWRYNKFQKYGAYTLGCGNHCIIPWVSENVVCQ